MTPLPIDCAACGAPNRPHARHCANCGQQLTPPPAPAGEAAPLPVAPAEGPGPETPPPPLSEAATRPLASHSLPEARLAGAIFGAPPPGAAGDRPRYRWLGRVAFERSNQLVYHVAPDRPALACTNTDCGAVPGFVPDRFCIHCGSPLAPGDEPLLLFETLDPELHARAAATVGRAAGPHALLPLDYFAEQTGGEGRHCLVQPHRAASAGATPEPVEQEIAMQWGAQLARGLDDLHAAGLTFRGLAGSSTVATHGQRAYWADFSACVALPAGVLPSAGHRAADLHALARLLLHWVAGDAASAAAPDLLPGVQRALATALGTTPPATGEELARLLSASAIAAEGASAGSILYRPVELLSGGRTDPGQRRELNEDNFLVMQREMVWRGTARAIGMYVVADGMGGHSAGELASRIIVETLKKKAAAELFAGDRGQPADPASWVAGAALAANDAVFSHRKTRGTDMGSTVVLAYVIDSRAYIAHLGDSRAYWVDPGGMRQLTTDHSLVERLVSAGRISRADARRHPQRNVIYKTVGDRLDIDPDVIVCAFEPGQSLLLCSDGLSGMLDDAQIARLIAAAPSPRQAVDALVEAANQAGGDDNITAILVHFAARGDPP